MHKDQKISYHVLSSEKIEAAKIDYKQIVQQDYYKEVKEDPKKGNKCQDPKLRKLGLFWDKTRLGLNKIRETQ